MIYYSIPWDSSGNVGRYYNAFMKTLPNDDDVACFMDADAAILTTSSYGRQLEAILRRYPEAGLFFGTTNRVGCQAQVHPGSDPASNDIAEHRKFADQVRDKYWDECVTVAPSKTDLMSGVFFMLRKSAWIASGGFTELGMLGVDNHLHRKINEAGIPVMLMKGVYVYHWYRGGNRGDVSHLQRGKRAVYTVISGGYDTLLDPEVVTPGWDYVCFTDTPGVQSSIWNVIRFTPELDPVREARRPKILAHRFMGYYDLTVWVDANMRIKCNLDDLVDRFHGQGPLTMLQHPERDCIYEEAEACKRLGKDDPAVIDKHVEMLRLEGCPEKNGLVATGVMIRSKHKSVRRLCEHWWDLVMSGSRRDQLSFNFASWKERVPYKAVPFDAVVGPMVDKVPHRRMKVFAEPAVRPAEPQKPVAPFDLSKGDPLVTVVIPTRNRPKLLAHAIGMIRMQTWRKTEIVILDDSDREWRHQTIKAASIRHVILEDRVSVGEKHDMGLKVAQGDVIAHWDDDDWFAAGRLAAQIDAMRSSSADVNGIMRDLVWSDGRFWRIDPSLENAGVRAEYTFHDGTAMFLRGAVPAGVSYGSVAVGQKVVFLNALKRAGARLSCLRNDGLFVYIRHGKNNWKFDESAALTGAETPTWFPPHESDFYASIGRNHAGQADPVR